MGGDRASGGGGGANTSSSTQALLMELNFHGEEESFFLEREVEIKKEVGVVFLAKWRK